MTINEFIELCDKTFNSNIIDVEEIEGACCNLFIGDKQHILGQFRYDMARELERVSGGKYKIKILEHDAYGPLSAGLFCRGDKRYVIFG